MPRYHSSTEPARIKKFEKLLQKLLPPEAASAVPKTPASKKKGRKKVVEATPPLSDAPTTPVSSKRNRASVEESVEVSPSPVLKKGKVEVEEPPVRASQFRNERRDSGVPGLPDRSFSRSSTFVPTSFGRAQEDPYTDYGVPARDLVQAPSRWGTPNSGYVSGPNFGNTSFSGGYSSRPAFGYQAPQGRVVTDEQRVRILDHVRIVNEMVREISARLEDIDSILK